MDSSAQTMDTVSGHFPMNMTLIPGFGAPVAAPDGCELYPFSINNPWENPDDPVSHDTYKTLTKILNRYIMPVLFLLAVPFNIINMIVFFRHGVKERINLCLFCLALDDLIVMLRIFEMNLDWLCSLIDDNHSELSILKFNHDYEIHSTAAFNDISRFMSLLTAMERCLCVVSPLKARSMIDVKTTAIIIGVGHAVIFACYVVFALQFQVICLYDPFLQEKKMELFYTDFYTENEDFMDIYESVVFGIFLIGSFNVGVIISTVATLVKLHQMKEWREKSSTSTTHNASQDLSLTRMLVANNIVFILCTTPRLIYNILRPFYPELQVTGEYINTNGMMIQVTELLAAINSTVSFIFYYTFGTKFRRSVQQMFCRPQKKQGYA